MKTLLTLVLAVCFVPLAGAQGTTDPGQPAPAETPAKLVPSGSPAQPSQIPPAQPSTDKPAMPSTDKPAQPSQIPPAQPSTDKPAQPSTEKPAQPGVITPQEPTTPAVIAAPEDTFFRPFKPAATAQVAAPDQPADAKPARTNVDPVLALKRQQAKELKTLRESLKTRPNAELNKAVGAMEADHKAALKALKAANKVEAEKDQKVRSRPAKKGIKKQLDGEPAK